MHEQEFDMLKAIALQAADLIVRETGDEGNVWVVALREFDPSVAKPPPRALLHMKLRNAEDSFYRTLPELAKKLERLRSTVDTKR